jgi:NAD(P)H-hydrate epimerase
MAALTGLTVEEVQKDRENTALRFAKEWNQVVILKGALTVIAEPGGSLVIIPAATSALAKAGTGDVLSGMVGGLMAQGVAPFDAAVAGAWFHARAAVQAAKTLGSERPVMAVDVINALPGVLS